ncbi:amino acid deaminase [Microbacterium sp. SZ1]|nr:amino acid deaminase [Microbacterium sp. SZ1]
MGGDGTAGGARSAVAALPWLFGAIADDRAAARFDAWGRSTVIDENTGSPVITRALFDELHDRAGLDQEWPVGNAGLLHCYGYLLSLTETPYGLKRDRWIEPALAEACTLPRDAFSPWRGGPTLLTRATAAASALLRSPAAGAARTVEGRESRVALSATRGPAALAYEVAPATGAEPLLVTMFPVGDADAVLAEFIADPRLRWNAV